MKLHPIIFFIGCFYMSACLSTKTAEHTILPQNQWTQQYEWRIDELIFHWVDSMYRLEIQCNESSDRKNFYQHAHASSNWNKPALDLSFSSDSIHLHLWDLTSTSNPHFSIRRSWSMDEIRSLCQLNVPFAFSEAPILRYPRIDIQFSTEMISDGVLHFSWLNPEAMKIVQYVEICDFNGKQLLKMNAVEFDARSREQRIALPLKLLPGKYFIRVVAAHDQWATTFMVLP